MKKNWKAIFAGCALAASLTGAALAAGSARTETLYFNGISLKVDGEGYTVQWDGATQTVSLTAPEAPAAAKQTYITRTGSKYHNDPHCNGSTYWPVPLDTAIGMGLTPCSKCIG